MWPRRRIRSRSLAGPGPTIDVTPLIDVVFQLMIFFMLTSSFVFQPGVKVHLPKAVTAEPAQKENLIVTIARGNRLYLDNRVVTLQELQQALRPIARSHPPVLIRADRDASMGRVVEIWDHCRAMGISEVHLATHAIDTDNADETR